MKRLSVPILVLLCAFLGAGCLPSWATPPTGSVAVPDSIDSTGATDVSAAMNSFVASVPNGSAIDFKANGRYRMESTLLINGRSHLTFRGHNATFFATTPGDRVRSNVKVNRSTAIVFMNLTVKGANPHAGTGDAAWVVEKEGQQGFDVRSVVGFALEGVTVTDVYGDFVYLGKDEEHGWTTNVEIENSHFFRNGRMGISITAARNVMIENNVFDQMRRSTFDMEAHHADFGAQYVTIRNNTLGVGRLSTLASVGIGTVDHFTFQGNHLAGLLNIVMQSQDGSMQDDWRILDNVGTGVAGNPKLSVMYFDHINGLQVHGNYQEMDSWRAMVGSRVADSCNVAYNGNNYPGIDEYGNATGQGIQGVLTGTCSLPVPPGT